MLHLNGYNKKGAGFKVQIFFWKRSHKDGLISKHIFTFLHKIVPNHYPQLCNLNLAKVKKNEDSDLANFLKWK